MHGDSGTIRKLQALHCELETCRACPNVVGPVVHGPAVPSRILLVGQAPGVREGEFGRPFAWTAGRTLFQWFERALGVDEQMFRNSVYMSAVARCFPGKAARGGGDRKPDPEEIARCAPFLEAEVRILKPALLIPVGTLAIAQIFGEPRPLSDVVGRSIRVTWHGREMECVALPHPSGASTWHRMEPGKTLLARALRILARHPEMRVAFKNRALTRPRSPSR
ncbi:MAG TPA: uracil-DNA glycosylase family protein [Myxococcaceae bacterium]|nr:uracil-DNA glycosylase family protein [Myxococcaceae bacterium]